MHAALLVTHSIVRWAVLALALLALVRALGGVARHRAWARADRRSLALFVGVLDLQFLLGVLLFAVSPITRAAMHDVGAAMRQPDLRFFLVEHPLTMLAAIAVAHAGNVIVKRAPLDDIRFRRAAITVALSLGLVLAGIPWSRLGTG